MKRFSGLEQLILVLIVGLAAWLPCVRDAGFVWDDDQYVTGNETLEDVEGLRRIWFEPRSIPQYYPLTHTSFWIEHRLHGEDPRGYRLVNVLLHIGSALLLLEILRRLKVPGAFAAALIFLVHPIQMESVAWITERKNVLSLLLVLASLRFLLGWRERGGAGIVIAFLFFAAALASKSVTCALPAAYLVIAWWQGGISRRDLVAMAPFFLLGALAAWNTGQLEAEHVGARGDEWDLTITQRLGIAGRALFFYAGKLLFPWSMSFNYERWEIGRNLIEILPFVAALALLATTIVARRRIGRGPAAALMLFGGLLVPALGFVDVYPMRYSFVADHFAYHASPAFIALLVALGARLLGKRGGFLVPILLVLMMVGIWNRTTAWSGEQALFEETLESNPRSWLAHANLGMLAWRRGDDALALEHSEAAVAIRPDLGELQTALASDLERLGRSEEALAAFEAARDTDPRDARFRLNLARAYMRRGRMDDAREEVDAAMKLAPESSVVHGLNGALLLIDGRIDAALPELRAAVAIENPDPTDLMNLAVCLEKSGEQGEALTILDDLVERIFPPNQAMHLRARLLATRRGEFDRDLLVVVAAKMRDPAWASPPGEETLLELEALSTVDARLGAFEAALDHARRGLELAQARGNLEKARLFGRLVELYAKNELLLLW